LISIHTERAWIPSQHLTSHLHAFPFVGGANSRRNLSRTSHPLHRAPPPQRLPHPLSLLRSLPWRTIRLYLTSRSSGEGSWPRSSQSSCLHWQLGPRRRRFYHGRGRKPLHLKPRLASWVPVRSSMLLRRPLRRQRRSGVESGGARQHGLRP
ncbi:hypothetical protein FKP32DRAFT_1742759, partial [Trametes sanguinea]